MEIVYFISCLTAGWCLSAGRSFSDFHVWVGVLAVAAAILSYRG